MRLSIFLFLIFLSISDFYAQGIISTPRNGEVTIEDLMDRGDRAFDNFKYKAAINYYNQVIEIDENHLTAKRMKVYCWYFLDECSRGLNLINQVIEKDSLFYLDYILRGRLKMCLEQVSDSYLDLNKAIKLNPDDEEANFYYGLIQIELNSFDSAFFYLNRAIQIEPQKKFVLEKGRLYAMLGDFNAAVSTFNTIIEKDSTYKAAFLLEFEKAIADYTRAIKNGGDTWGNYNNRALLYDQLKKYEKAILDYTTAIQLTENNPGYIYNNRGNSYRKLKQFEKAKEDVKKSLEHNSGNGWAYATLAMIHADEGNEDLFFENLEIAVSKSISYPIEETLAKYKDDPRLIKLMK